MERNSELVLANTQNIQPTVKDGAQEKLYKQFQEISKKVEIRIQKKQENKLRSIRLEKCSKYYAAARELMQRRFGWEYDDFENIKREHGGLAILDKFLVRKVAKKLLAMGFCSAVSITTFCIVNIASVNVLLAMGTKVNPPKDVALAILCVIGWLALAVGDVVCVCKSARYLNGSLRPYFAFLHNRKQALLTHQELEKEAEIGGI